MSFSPRSEHEVKNYQERAAFMHRVPRMVGEESCREAATNARERGQGAGPATVPPSNLDEFNMPSAC